MSQEVEVVLERVGPARFEARNAAGATALLEGSEELGGTGQGVRPMEMLLMSLAGCSSLDVIHILEKKQKEPLEGLRVTVHGTRADAIPAVYTHIRVRFEASGAVDVHKLERACALSMEKYCSVARMLMPQVTITHEAVLAGG